MATFKSARTLNLGLSFRSVFTKGDEYTPPLLQLPPESSEQLFGLLDREYRSVIAQGLDAAAAIITLSPDQIPKDLLNRIDRALKEGNESAENRTKNDMGAYLSLPLAPVTGFVELPGNWSALVCKDDRGAFKVCGLSASYRVINGDNVIDLSLIYAEPFRK